MIWISEMKFSFDFAGPAMRTVARKWLPVRFFESDDLNEKKFKETGGTWGTINFYQKCYMTNPTKNLVKKNSQNIFNEIILSGWLASSFWRVEISYFE